MADYVDELNKKLEAARKRVKQGNEARALKKSAPTLFEIIDGEISLEINRGYGEKALGYEEYLESHGAVRGIKRIRDLLNSKEAEADQAVAEAEAIKDNIKQIEDDRKKQAKQQ